MTDVERQKNLIARRGCSLQGYREHYHRRGIRDEMRIVRIFSRDINRLFRLQGKEEPLVRYPKPERGKAS